MVRIILGTVVLWGAGVVLTALALPAPVTPGRPAVGACDFQADAVGSPLAGFSFGRTGEGRPGRWVVQLDPAPWRRGDRLQVLWGAEAVVDAKDDTFKEAGKVGVWTKADSVTSFDALRVTAHD